MRVAAATSVSILQFSALHCIAHAVHACWNGSMHDCMSAMALCHVDSMLTA